MPDTPQLLMFIAAGWLLNLTPGPDVLYVVTHSLRAGARAGIVAGFGITTGCFVHIFAAALGVSALLATSVTTFNVLKWLGAAYLLYVGVRLLFSRAVGNVMHWLDRVAGLMFVGFGLKLAMSDNPSS